MKILSNKRYSELLDKEDELSKLTLMMETKNEVLKEYLSEKQIEEIDLILLNKAINILTNKLKFLGEKLRAHSWFINN